MNGAHFRMQKIRKPNGNFRSARSIIDQIFTILQINYTEVRQSNDTERSFIDISLQLDCHKNPWLLSSNSQTTPFEQFSSQLVTSICSKKWRSRAKDLGKSKHFALQSVSVSTNLESGVHGQVRIHKITSVYLVFAFSAVLSIFQQKKTFHSYFAK